MSEKKKVYIKTLKFLSNAYQVRFEKNFSYEEIANIFQLLSRNSNSETYQLVFQTISHLFCKVNDINHLLSRLELKSLIIQTVVWEKLNKLKKRIALICILLSILLFYWVKRTKGLLITHTFQKGRLWMCIMIFGFTFCFQK